MGNGSSPHVRQIALSSLNKCELSCNRFYAYKGQLMYQGFNQHTQGGVFRTFQFILPFVNGIIKYENGRGKYKKLAHHRGLNPNPVWVGNKPSSTRPRICPIILSGRGSRSNETIFHYEAIFHKNPINLNSTVTF